MTEALYERYKDALRRGHVAGLRGRLDVALAAYVEAATLAPERALPHASIGGVYLRLGRPADALVAFDAALERAPTDVSALHGRADALVALDRPVAAAVALDTLAGLVEADGKPGAALDVAVRSLDLAESRPRRRNVRRLLELARRDTTPPDPEVVERAERILDRAEMPPASAAVAPDAQAAGPVAEIVPEEPPPPPPPDPVELLELARAALDSGDADVARTELLRAAARFGQTGADDAALDACYQAVTLAPADPSGHLALTDLYLERGWTGAAIDKLLLLDRLGRLDDDGPTLERVRILARERLADDERVRDLIG